MQKNQHDHVQPLGICGRLYSFIIAIFIGRHQEACSTNTEDSESGDEFWEAEDEGNETDEEVVMSARKDLQRGREVELVQELGVHNGTSLALVQETRQRQSKRTKVGKEGGEEVGVKMRKGRILSRVFCNINEKSDAFIRSRKEAMRRSYSVGSKMVLE